jgi:hypothetical protein
MGGPDAIVAVGVPLDEGAVLVGADHRARVTGQRHDGKDAEDGVDGSAFESEVAEVSAGEEGAVGLEQLRGGPPAIRLCMAVGALVSNWLLGSRLELHLLGPHTRHPRNVADQSQWFLRPIFDGKLRP